MKTNLEIIKNFLIKNLILEKIYINNNNNYYELILISSIFINLNTVKRHQLIYNLLKEYIRNNIIHAISINTFTPNEWKNIKHKYINKYNI